MVKLINLSIMGIVMLILLIIPASHAGGGPLFPKQKTVVKIVNHLTSKATLNVICKGKGKSADLGAHVVPFNGVYAFGVTATFGGSTVYTCRFSWSKQMKWFDIYVQRRDFDTCENVCRWVIKEIGPCLVLGRPPFISSASSFQSTKCYPWKK